MKKVTLRLIALQIEYHWWCVSRLRRQVDSAQCQFQQQLHKLKARQLQKQFDILVGILDFDGNYCR